MNADDHMERIRRLLLVETGSQSVTLAISTKLSKAGYEICRSCDLCDEWIPVSHRHFHGDPL